MPLGERLRQERIRCHLSQAALAEALGISVQSISRWERGQTVPQARYRSQLSALLGSPPETLFAELQELEEPPCETFWMVPYLRNPYFTGREAVLQRVRAALTAQPAPGSGQALALSGLAGVGKTQTAVEYAFRYAQDYQAVFWVPAETHRSLLTGFMSIARLLQLPVQGQADAEQVIQVVKWWLMRHNGWLLIFDNVEDCSTVAAFFPPQGSGHLLLTTRLQTTGTVAERVDLECLSIEEGVRFLLRRARLPHAARREGTEPHAQAAREICALLGGLPLALDQAGAYIEEVGCSLLEYLERLHCYSDALLRRRGGSGRGHPHSVSKTFALSFAEIEARHPVAADLLRLCAFLAPDAIPEELFASADHEQGATEGMFLLDPFSLDEAIATLRHYSFLRRQAERKTLSLHRLVQASLKPQMDRPTFAYWARQAIGVVNHLFPTVEELTRWSECERLLPQALACAHLIEQEQVVSKEAGRLLYQTGVYLLESAHYGQAEHCLQQALALRRQLVGPEHPDIADTLNMQAELCYYRGEYERSAQMHQQVLSMRVRLFGESHLAVAISLNNLAGIYCMQGRYREAEPLYHRTLAMRELALGGDHIDVAETLQNLAYLNFMQGDYRQAEMHYQRALAILQQCLDPDHAYLTTIFNNLGKLSQAQWDYKQAERYYRQALHICEKQFGSQHPRLALTLSHLAELAAAQEDYAQAEQLHRHALSIREHVLGSQHPRTAQSLHALAQLSQIQSRYAQAEILYQRALTIRLQALGSEHPDTEATRKAYKQLLVQRAGGEAFGSNSLEQQDTRPDSQTDRA